MLVVWKGRSLYYSINNLTVIRSCSLLSSSWKFATIWCPCAGLNSGGSREEEMGSKRTTTRQYSEYSDFFSTQREREYDQDTDLPQRESTQIRWGGQDGRREPDSGLGHTQDYRRGGQTMIGSIRTHSYSRQSGRSASHKSEI